MEERFTPSPITSQSLRAPGQRVPVFEAWACRGLKRVATARKARLPASFARCKGLPASTPSTASTIFLRPKSSSGIYAKNRKFSHGFSLIEILVSVTVIGILASIIVAGIQSARERSQLVACASTMRQWALSFVLYAQENEGKLPTKEGGSNDWQEAIAPYMASGADGAHRIALRRDFSCPKDEHLHGAWGYGINYQLTQRNGYYPQYLSALPISSRLLLFTDTEAPGVWSTIARTPGKADGIAYDRHDGVANFVFTDMHVRPMREAEASEYITIIPERY